MNLGISQQDQPLPFKERRAMAEEHIKNLKNGVLVVRLPSQQNKIETLQTLIDGGNLDKKTEAKLQGRLDGTKAKTASFNKSIITAFQEQYNFSDFLFMMDTAATQLKEGVRQGIFLDKNLELDQEAAIVDSSVYVLRFGSTYSGRGQNIEAAVITDSNLEDLLPPFPYYVRINNFDAIMGGLFPKPKQELKNAMRLVEKLQRNLVEFARQVE